MTPTVDDLRNEIRESGGRYERVESTAFPNEALAASCEAVGNGIDANRLPSKSRMRAAILRSLDLSVGDDPDGADRPFRKAELESVAAALRSESSRDYSTTGRASTSGTSASAPRNSQP